MACEGSLVSRKRKSSKLSVKTVKSPAATAKDHASKSAIDTREPDERFKSSVRHVVMLSCFSAQGGSARYVSSK